MFLHSFIDFSLCAFCAFLWLVTDPAVGDEFSFCGVNRKYVSAHCAYATVWTKGNAWRHAGVVLVETLKRSDELFATQISSSTLQPFREDPRCCKSIELRRYVSMRKLVLLLQCTQ